MDGTSPPDRLWQRLEPWRKALVRQGTLVQKPREGRQYWYLRFYAGEPGGPAGRKKQRSIYIGSAANAERVRVWLAETRELSQFVRESIQLGKLACCALRAVLRRGRRLT